jgi:hypothetical protein
VVLKFQREPDEFERLKADPFWEASRQKPKDPATSKWVLYFVMQAKTKNVRNRAGRYAVVLDGLSARRSGLTWWQLVSTRCTGSRRRAPTSLLPSLGRAK